MELRKKPARLALLSLGLLLLILVPRLVGINQFVAIDEPAWLLFASNYYLAITRGELAKTVYDYHPGVTTLWIFVLAFLSYFPGYRLVGRFTDKYWNVDLLFQKYHKLPLRLLVNARIISIVATGMALVLSFGLLDILVGAFTALVVVLMIAFDPFFLGHSRLLNHESMMAVLILISILAGLVFIEQRRKIRYLLLSGAAAGLALLTKSPAIVLIPLMGLIFAVSFFQEFRGRAQKGRLFVSYAGNFSLWLAVLCLTYFVVWPGMWVAPGSMLYAVFGNAASYAFQGARLSVTQEVAPQHFQFDLTGIGAYLIVVFLKTTPIAWLGCLLALIGMFVRKGAVLSATSKRIILYLALLGLGFVMMFGIAQGRDHNHYILTSFVAIDVIAGIGIAWGCRWLASVRAGFQARWVMATLLTVLVALHFSGALPQYPYYYTYINPISQRIAPGWQDPDLGYGEGLEQAGKYLSAMPNSAENKVMSWYAAGSFSYFYPGTSYNLLSSEVVYGEYSARMRESSYLVVYSIVQKAANMPVKLLQALESIQPVHTIYLNGKEYVQIYRVKDFPDAFFTAIVN